LGLGGTSSSVSIHITDPVSGYNYYLFLSDHIANRARLRAHALKGCAATGAPVSIFPSEPGDAPQSLVPGQYRPQTSQESLGTKTIEGVTAEGVRTTATWPVGAVGNDKPLIVVTEVWNSPELGIEVLRKLSDPRIGESITRLTRISRAEPDAALFKPPPDYRIEGPGR
jgi:hypothetical protein